MPLPHLGEGDAFRLRGFVRESRKKLRPDLVSALAELHSDYVCRAHGRMSIQFLRKRLAAGIWYSHGSNESLATSPGQNDF